MKRQPLGPNGPEITQICLGTMTWGAQNTETEGHAQIDRALERGVNFLDTAEMYPGPGGTDENTGRTEEVIGTWLAKGGARDDIIIATKVSGIGLERWRGGAPISGATMREAIEGSLRRLQTDHVDLYQLHWPNRGHFHFRRSWTYDPTSQDGEATRAHILDVLETTAALIEEGKIGALGLSNETAWGTAEFLKIADREGLPRVVSIQNEYSLLYRHFDLDLAELSHNERVGLLAYSPLAAGLLSDKYAGGAVPVGSRMAMNADLGGRKTATAMAATEAYAKLAREAGITPTQLAIAFCLTRPFMASAIIGATSIAQLDEVLDAVDVTLSEEVLASIGELHRAYPVPY